LTTPDEASNLLSMALSRHIEDEKERNRFIQFTISKLLENLGSLEPTITDTDLLEEMINRGFFPSFSFPLEVAKFEVLGTKKKPNEPFVERHIWASTSQDMKVALSEFAPGRQITINKQTYQVGGIGVNYPNNPVDHLEEKQLGNSHYQINQGTGKKEILEGAQEWKFFHRCISPECGVIFKSTDPSFNLEDDENCPSCSSTPDDNNGQVVSNRMITPEVFRPLMVPYRDGRELKNNDNYINDDFLEMRGEEFSFEKSSHSRIGRASLPMPLTDWEGEGFKKKWQGEELWKNLRLFQMIDSEDIGEATRLLIVNEGPENWSSSSDTSSKGNGFKICCNCGHVAMQSNEGSHFRPYAITRSDVLPFVIREFGIEDKDELNAKVKEIMNKSKSKCNGMHSDHIVLGHEFRTDIVVLRFPLNAPLTNNWNTSFFDSAVRAIKEAMITEVTSALDLMDREIGGNYRKVILARKDGSKEQFIDIFLYDQVSGGAGLVSRIQEEIIDNPKNNIEYILDQVHNRLKGKKCANSNEEKDIINPCERICTCLLDFRNKMEHSRMSRPLGLHLLEFLRDGTPPSVSPGDISLLVSQLKSLYLGSDLSISHSNQGEIVVKKESLVRKIKPYSILKIKPVGIHWDTVRSSQHLVNNEEIHVPYELLRDAPHMLMQIAFPVDSGINPDNPEDLFSDF